MRSGQRGYESSPRLFGSSLRMIYSLVSSPISRVVLPSLLLVASCVPPAASEKSRSSEESNSASTPRDPETLKSVEEWAKKMRDYSKIPQWEDAKRHLPKNMSKEECEGYRRQFFIDLVWPALKKKHGDSITNAYPTTRQAFERDARCP